MEDKGKEKLKEKSVAGKVKNNVLPANAEAERSLLGCILLDAAAASDILPFISEDDFYTQSHALIAGAMKKIYSSNLPVDFVTLCDELERGGLMAAAGGLDYITALASALPSSAHFNRYLNIVRRDSVLRRLIAGSGEIVRTAYDADDSGEALAYAEKLIFDIGQTYQSGTLTPVAPVLAEVVSRFDAVHKDKDAFKGLSTGFSGLDYLINGLHGGDLVIIAARPGMGKTALAMNIVENAAIKKGAKCAVFSLEMPRLQIAQRMLCSVANVSMTDAVKGKLGMEQWTEIMKANDIISKTEIYIDDGSLITPPEILSKCRRLKAKSGLDLIMLDYIQLMNSGNRKNENRQQEISEITRNLKIIAKELNVPVLALSQLSRSVEKRDSHMPVLSDLRESGAIEQDADIVMFIHRPDKAEDAAAGKLNGTVKNGMAELLVEKNRNGQTGSVPLTWKGEYVKFLSRDRTVDDALARQYQTNKAERHSAARDFAPVPEADEAFIPPPPDEDGDGT